MSLSDDLASRKRKSLFFTPEDRGNAMSKTLGWFAEQLEIEPTLEAFRKVIDHGLELPGTWQAPEEIDQLYWKIARIQDPMCEQRWELEALVEWVDRNRGLIEILRKTHGCRHIPLSIIDLLALDNDSLKDMGESLSHYDGAMRLSAIYRRVTTDHEMSVGKSQVDDSKRRCKIWWTRQLKRLILEVQGQMDWIYGRVGGGSRKWASSYATSGRKSMIEAQKEWMSDQVLVREEDGKREDLKTIADIAEKARAAENYAISQGLQRILEASKGRLKMVMITVTLPGEYSPAQGKRKTKFNGCSPAQANKALSDLVKKIRMSLMHGLVVSYGFVVREPQETGSPHAHILVMVDDAVKAIDIARSYRMVKTPSGDYTMMHEIRGLKTKEQVWKTPNGRKKRNKDGSYRDSFDYHSKTTIVAGTSKSGEDMAGITVIHQIDARAWTEESDDADHKASMASYIFKYLAKGSLTEGDDAFALQAWRAACRCRTTSFFGMGKALKARWRGIWRADVTMNQPTWAPDRQMPRDPKFLATKEAMENGQWGKALSILTGIDEEIQLVWEDVRSERISSYGQRTTEREAFVLESGEELLLDTGTWTMHERDDLVQEDAEKYDGEFSVPAHDPETGEILVPGRFSGKIYKTPETKAKDAFDSHAWVDEILAEVRGGSALIISSSSAPAAHQSPRGGAPRAWPASARPAGSDGVQERLKPISRRQKASDMLTKLLSTDSSIRRMSMDVFLGSIS